MSMDITFMCICLVMCALAVRTASVYADEDGGPASSQDLENMFSECAKEHGVTDNEIQEASNLEDVTLIAPCFWACCFEKSGFLNYKGEYVLFPGLNYIRTIVKKDITYTNIETIARRCESVNDQPLKGVEAGCERGSLVAACFMEQKDQLWFFN